MTKAQESRPTGKILHYYISSSNSSNNYTINMLLRSNKLVLAIHTSKYLLLELLQTLYALNLQTCVAINTASHQNSNNWIFCSCSCCLKLIASRQSPSPVQNNLYSCTVNKGTTNNEHVKNLMTVTCKIKGTWLPSFRNPADIKPNSDGI